MRIYISPGPIFCPFTKEDYDYFIEGMAKSFYTTGIWSKDVVFVTLNYHWVPAGTVIDEGCRRIGAAVVPAGSGMTEMQVEMMKRANATVFIGTPTFLNKIREVVKEKGIGFFSNKAYSDGYRVNVLAELGGLGVITNIHPVKDFDIFRLWEDINWKKAEVKKIKADYWPYRHLLRQKRWPRWSYPEIHELKEEIKRLKRKGKGNERIEEVEEPREYGMKRKSKEWLKEYRELKKKIREDDRSEKVRELRRRWKENKKWFLETSNKYNLQYYSFLEGGLDAAPEVKEKMSQLYIPTETDFEKELYQEIRGDLQRENMLGPFALRKLSKIELGRLLGNRKAFGFGKTVRPNIIDEIFCRESRESQNSDFNTYIFRTARFVKGIGEWKELTKEVRAKNRIGLSFIRMYFK